MSQDMGFSAVFSWMFFFFILIVHVSGVSPVNIVVLGCPSVVSSYCLSIFLSVCVFPLLSLFLFLSFRTKVYFLVSPLTSYVRLYSCQSCLSLFPSKYILLFFLTRNILSSLHKSITPEARVAHCQVFWTLYSILSLCPFFVSGRWSDPKLMNIKVW